jgi:DNA-binding transcriptional LysR family regulator
MAQDLRQLRCFVAVAATLNFTRAAEELRVTQQSLSTAIRRLEAEIGVQLFARTTRKVELTDAGAARLPGARRLLALADEVFANAADGHGTRLLTVDISSSGLETGAAVLRRLRDIAPEVGVRQVETGVPRGIAALRSGELDVLFGNAVHAPDDIEVEPIRLEPVLILLRADDPRIRPQVPAATLAEDCWLLPADELAPEWNEQIVNVCQQAGFRPRRYPGVTHGSAAAAELVLEGRCVVPTTAWTRLPPGVVARPLVEPAALFPWSLMWVAERRDEATTALLRAARETSRANGWLDEVAGVTERTPGRARSSARTA